MIVEKNNFMLSKKIIVTISLLCCFFKNIQGGINREQLEEKLGKPVYNFVHLIDFSVADEWLYTTELSKILLVGEGPIIEFSRCLPIVGSCIVPLFGRIYSNCDNRFENFVENIGKVSQQKLREAIQDTLLLTGGSTKAYSMSKLLHNLEDTLQSKIGLIQDQIKFDFKYDQESLYSMQQSLAYAAGLIVAISLTNTYINHVDKNVDNKTSFVEFLNSIAVLGLLPVSYQIFKNSYDVLTKDPHVLNQYLKEYQDLLEFVQNLNSQLKTDGCITFKLDNGNIATAKELSDFWFLSPLHTLNFS